MKRKNINTLIRASSVANYMMDDCLADYFKQSYDDDNKSAQYIMEQGNQFESELIKIIMKDHIVYTPINGDMKYNETIDAMIKGYDIIYQGYLCDYNRNIGGSPDLIIKSTYFNKLFPNTIIPHGESNINNVVQPYYYIIVDIKHSTIHLTTTNHIKNNKRIPAYKAQLYIYTSILNNLQNVTINRAYIWGKDYTPEYDFLNTVGIIDYDTIDKKYKTDAMKAVEWLLLLADKEQTINPISNILLYPNMKQPTYKHDKKQINNSVHDITTLWNCGINHRMKAFNKNIYSYDDVMAEDMGMSKKKAKIVNNIISINTQNDDMIRITNKHAMQHTNKQPKTLQIFIDFEGFSEKLKCKINNGIIQQLDKYYIYMIGIGHNINNMWKYKSFILPQTSEEQQNNLFKSLFYYLRNLQRQTKTDFIQFYHWSHYEMIFFNKLTKNINLCISDNNYKFIDLCAIYQSSVVIKDCFNFKLKNIASALYRNNLIKTCYEANDCMDGLDATIMALQLYDNNKVKNNPVLLSIEKYNETDCKVLYELYELLEKLSL